MYLTAPYCETLLKKIEVKTHDSNLYSYGTADKVEAKICARRNCCNHTFPDGFETGGTVTQELNCPMKKVDENTAIEVTMTLKGDDAWWGENIKLEIHKVCNSILNNSK